MRGLFVTATDTGVGKTILSASLLAAIAAAGEPVRAFKPAVTGLEDPQEIAARGLWPPDHELLGAVARMAPEQVAPARYAAAASPRLAAQLAGTHLNHQQLLEHARAGDAREVLIVEGVGGLLVPLAEHFSICDLAVELALELVIAARPGLGTINHTLLTLQAARSAGLYVCAVVLTPWPATPSTLERSNRDTIAELGEVDVHTLSYVPAPTAAELARAGAQLPWRQWLGER
jgi:dethiobiotin synthetase